MKFKDLIQTAGLLLLVLLFVLEIKKSSENDQSTGHFQSFFFITLNLKKNSSKSSNKKILGLIWASVKKPDLFAWKQQRHISKSVQCHCYFLS